MYIKKFQKNKKLTLKIQMLTDFGVSFIFYIVILSRVFLK